jgi:hypothetical protein
MGLGVPILRCPGVLVLSLDAAHLMSRLRHRMSRHTTSLEADRSTKAYPHELLKLLIAKFNVVGPTMLLERLGGRDIPTAYIRIMREEND